MKKILMIITSLLFIICLISCSEEEKVEQINIKFVIEENIYDIKKELNYIVNIDDIPNINEEDIEGIYYDSNYSSKYNNEVLDKDTILYVRRVKENIEVTFIVGDIEEVVTMKGNSVVSLDNIPNISKDNILCVYYDKEYKIEYQDEPLKENTILYVKTKYDEIMIKQIYCNYHHNNSEYSNLNISDVNVKYYLGQYGNAHCAVIDGDTYQIQVYLEYYYVKVQEEIFKFKYLPEYISVYCGGQYYLLPDACNLGILTIEDVRKLYNYCIKNVF